MIGPVEAVKAYHAVLGKLGIKAKRALADDLTSQSSAMSYGGHQDLGHRPRPPRAREGRGRGLRLPRTRSPSPPAGPVLAMIHEPVLLNGSAAGLMKNGFPMTLDGRPDFARMDVPQRLAYHRDPARPRAVIDLGPIRLTSRASPR